MNRRPLWKKGRPPPRTVGFVGKWLVAGLILFAAIAGGIYTGLSAGPRTPEITRESLQNPAYLALGDRFPDYALYEPLGEKTISVSALAAQGPTLLIFVSETCNICQALGRYWRKMVVPGLREDIQLILVFDQEDWTGTLASDHPLLLLGARIFTTERAAQREEDGMVGTPIVVGLGPNAEIRFISPGLNRQVGSEFINKYL